MYPSGKIRIDGQRFSAGRTFPRLLLTSNMVLCERSPVIDFAADVFDLSSQIIDLGVFFFVSVDDR